MKRYFKNLMLQILFLALGLSMITTAAFISVLNIIQEFNK